MISIKALGLPSKRLIASYLLDWVVILAIAAVGGAWNWLRPYHRPFSLVDLTISYPLVDHETVPVWLLVVVALIAPAVIIFLVCLIFVPGPTAHKRTPRSLKWRRKFWEWNTGWMGLGLSLAVAFLVTQGFKNLLGKPRPSMLARCQPDLSRLQEFTVGDFGSSIDPRWVLVSSGICTQPDQDMLDEGFRSFPSGHASFSWAGLLYLTLFLCSKFAIAVPFLPPRPYSPNDDEIAMETERLDTLPIYHSRDASTSSTSKEGTTIPNMAHQHPGIVPIRNQAAAPPNYLLVAFFVPVGAAVYITCSRYFDFYHFGIDIIAGSLIGIVSAWFSFRWYHLPIRQGAGWAWGARSRDRAFAIYLGQASYVGAEGWISAKAKGAAPPTGASGDVEHGASIMTGPGMDGSVERDVTGGRNGVGSSSTV